MLLLDRAAGRWSWLCWTIALLIKPQAIILAPLLWIVTLQRYGTRGLLQGGLLSVGLIVLALLPLALADQGAGVAQAYFGSVGRFPKATTGAFNLWYLVTMGTRMHDSVQLAGLLSLRQIGLVLVLLAALLVVIALAWRAFRSDTTGAPIALQAAAVLALAFFLLPTQIHERYLFLTLAFLAATIASNRYMVIPYTLLVTTATLNILGDLKGFSPLAYQLIQASPLPQICAIVNLLVLAALVAHMFMGHRWRWHTPRWGTDN
ncbi:MAG: hypothetical protein HC837_17805 [Chloroflexaceae bacterium]|nr:hypothetical protein [Chloroflexaceae bacterium]